MKEELRKLKKQARDEEEQYARKIYEDRTKSLLQKGNENLEALQTGVDVLFIAKKRKNLVALNNKVLLVFTGIYIID